MEVFLKVNGKGFEASVDEQEEVMFDLAAGEIKQEEFFEWVRDHVIEPD